MSAIVKYDHMLFIENKHFLASSILTVENNQAGNIVLTFEGNHTVVVVDDIEKANFRTQFTEFIESNGIRMWGTL